ncbi:MAG: F0F1 ATP synthase subunit delta [Puniceicoccales bacterium]|jgi:F0F1-type ATP synthase delta subunit|nr:F0F1 ATP synthase subunit delta [Puniceicoccales bacterium]
MGLGKWNTLAKGLVEISLSEDGTLDCERMSCVVGVLGENYKGTQLRSILSAYLSELERFAAHTRLKIEYCGNLTEAGVDAMRSHFEKILGRKLNMELQRLDTLISGIRVTVGDFVIENSIAGTLDAYRNSMANLP